MKKNRFYNYRKFLFDRYGKNVYRVPINLNYGCPNRREDGSGGCLFCGANGALAVHLDLRDSLTNQVNAGVNYVRERYGRNVDLMAYFQAYTSTNAPIKIIRENFELVLKLEKFRAVTVSTRPDCLSGDVLQYFAELAKRYDFWVELGVQTANDLTLHKINRGHNFASARNAVFDLQKIGVNVAVHVILGLPGETVIDFENTAKELAKLPISGIKVHNLHIVKNSDLAQQKLTDFHLFDEFEYCENLCHFIRFLPANIPLMRVISDSPESDLIAPIWRMKKGQFLNFFTREMQRKNFYQGEFFEENFQSFGALEIMDTADGSKTFYSSFFKEKFHSSAGAITETEEKFIKPTLLAHRLEKSENLFLLDIGFGLGCNALSAFELAKKNKRKITIVTLEFDKEVLLAAREIYPQWTNIYDALLQKTYYAEDGCEIQIIWGDAREKIRELAEKQQQFDVIFHDAFSTQKNPELWSKSFFAYEKKLLRENGVWISYSNANVVRGGLLKNGFFLGETPAFGRTQGGTIAFLTENNFSQKADLLSEFSISVLQKTTNGIAFSDPLGNWSRKKILSHRERVVKKLAQLGFPKKINS